MMILNLDKLVTTNSNPILPECRRSCRPAVMDWMETHSRIMGFWLERLIAEGGDQDMVAMIDRQRNWLELMQVRLRDVNG